MDTSPTLFQIIVFVLGAHLVLAHDCVDKCNFAISCNEVEYVQVTPCSYKCTCDGLDTYHFEDSFTSCGFDKKCFQGECLNLVPHCEFLYGADYIGLLNQNNPCLYNCFAIDSNCFYTEENMPDGNECYTFSDFFGRCLKGRCATGYSSFSLMDEPEAYGSLPLGVQSNPEIEAPSTHDAEGPTGGGEDDYAASSRQSAVNEWMAADRRTSHISRSDQYPSHPMQAQEIFTAQQAIEYGGNTNQYSTGRERKDDTSRAVTKSRKSSYSSNSVNDEYASRPLKSFEEEDNDDNDSADAMREPEYAGQNGIIPALQITEGYSMERVMGRTAKGSQNDAGRQGVYKTSANNNARVAYRNSASGTREVVTEESEETSSNSVSEKRANVSSRSNTENVPEETESDQATANYKGSNYESFANEGFKEESDANRYSTSSETNYAGTRGITQALKIGDSFSRTRNQAPGSRGNTGVERAYSERTENNKDDSLGNTQRNVQEGTARRSKANRYSSSKMSIKENVSSRLQSDNSDEMLGNENGKAATSIKTTGRTSSSSRTAERSASGNRYSSSNVKETGYNKQQSVVSNSASEMAATGFVSSRLQSQSITGASASSNSVASSGTTGYTSSGLTSMAVNGAQSFAGTTAESNSVTIGGASGYEPSAAQFMAMAGAQSAAGASSIGNSAATVGAAGYASTGAQGLAAPDPQSIAGTSSISNSATTAGAAGFASSGAQGLSAAGAQSIAGASSSSNTAATTGALGYASSGAQGLAEAGSVASSSASSSASNFAGSSGSAFGETASLSSAFSQSSATGSSNSLGNSATNAKSFAGAIAGANAASFSNIPI